MYKPLLITHQIVVTIFFLIYVGKTILLLSNKSEVLSRFSRIARIPEMIVSFLFLITGIILMFLIPEVKPMLIIKISLVFLSIPLAVIGFKRGNKILASLSLLLITASYGLAEMSRKTKVKVSMDAVDSNGEINAKVLYMDNCALCHGADGKLGMAGAANLGLTQMNGSQIKETILKGKGAMQSVALSEEQAVAVAKYVEEELKGK